MNRLLLAAALLSVATAASAADIPARPYTKAPPPLVSPAYNWSGFYIGAMGGYGWDSGDSSGGFGGGTIGYNWQFPGSQFVFGIEVDAAGGSIKDSLTEDIGGGVLATEENQDQLVRQRDRPRGLRMGCCPHLRQGWFCVGQQKGFHFSARDRRHDFG
jgi:outer membrane immunogenic protein